MSSRHPKQLIYTWIYKYSLQMFTQLNICSVIAHMQNSIKFNICIRNVQQKRFVIMIERVISASIYSYIYIYIVNLYIYIYCVTALQPLNILCPREIGRSAIRQSPCYWRVRLLMATGQYDPTLLALGEAVSKYEFWDPFYWHILTFIPAWISNCTHYTMWDKIA